MFRRTFLSLASFPFATGLRKAVASITPKPLPYNITPASISMTWNTRVIETFAKLFPNGCELNEANIQKLVESGIGTHYLIKLNIPISGCFAFDGGKKYYLDGKLHRDSGPAIERTNGHKEYYQDDKLHRDGGPAIKYADGTTMYYWHGKLNRADGPAVEYADGSKEYFLDGRRHRTIGPAVEYSCGDKEYWLHGKWIHDGAA